MKTIKLKSESPLVKERHFIATEFFGQETIGFYYTEKEFIDRSVFYALFDTDLNGLPLKKGKLDEEYTGCRFDMKRKYADATFFCPSEFYIACDKGDRGYKSIFTVLKGIAQETGDEVTVTVTVIEDEALSEKVKEAYLKENITIGNYLSECLSDGLCKQPCLTFARPEVVIRAVEKTCFLDMEAQTDACKFEVRVGDEGFRLIGGCYKHIDGNFDVREGDYVFATPMRNVVEILRIEHFAHTPYAEFYAVASPAFVYPRDKVEIQEKFPDFYKKHCVSKFEWKKNCLLREAKEIPYISEDNQLGDDILYCRLVFNHHGILVNKDDFHLALGDGNFFGSFDAGMGKRLRECTGTKNAVLIQVGDKYKILFYNFEHIVKFKGEYYGQFRYSTETDFFTDFSNGLPRTRGIYNRLQNDTALKGVEYLLFKGDIEPIKVTRERYEEFKRPEKKEIDESATCHAGRLLPPLPQ